MKKVWTYFGIGCVVAIVGILFADVCGSFFNGLDYGSACTLGMGMYLCVVVITCTGLIISRLESGSKKEDSED